MKNLLMLLLQSLFDQCPEDWSEDRTIDGDFLRRRGNFFEDGWGFFIFAALKNEDPLLLFDFLGPKKENSQKIPIPFLSTFRPPTNPCLFLSALLRSRSSDRSFTSEIGPKIEIGSLLLVRVPE